MTQAAMLSGAGVIADRSDRKAWPMGEVPSKARSRRLQPCGRFVNRTLTRPVRPGSIAGLLAGGTFTAKGHAGGRRALLCRLPVLLERLADRDGHLADPL